MPLKPILTSLAFILLGILTVSLTWPKPLLTCTILIILAIVKHLISPIPHEFYWYLITALLGPFSEISIIYLGNAWTYPEPHLLSVPVWLFPLWGLAGILFVSLYQGVFHESSNHRR